MIYVFKKINFMLQFERLLHTKFYPHTTYVIFCNAKILVTYTNSQKAGILTGSKTVHSGMCLSHSIQSKKDYKYVKDSFTDTPPSSNNVSSVM